MKKIFGLWILCIMVILFPMRAIAEDDQLSFDKMRNSFDETFANKTISIPLVVEPQPPQQQIQEDPFVMQETSRITTSEETDDDSDHLISFLEWALGVVLAIWVVWDASNIGVKRGQVPGFPDFGPIGWFFLTLCCWCIGFPFYIAKRKRYIEANQRELVV